MRKAQAFLFLMLFLFAFSACRADFEAPYTSTPESIEGTPSFDLPPVLFTDTYPQFSSGEAAEGMFNWGGNLCIQVLISIENVSPSDQTIWLNFNNQLIEWADDLRQAGSYWAICWNVVYQAGDNVARVSFLLDDGSVQEHQWHIRH